MSENGIKIAIIGAGTIGLSFAALHLSKDALCRVSIYDSRPDIRDYVSATFPGYLTDTDADACQRRLTIANSLEDAVRDAAVVQEQGPENPAFKIKIWPEIETHAPRDALFWSSTSGIPASQQNQNMQDRTRLIVVHPYNPPHIMPLLEVVRSPLTSDEVIQRTLQFWRERGRTPVLVQKECTGFVANRLAFALFREACSLVAQGVVDVKDLDDVVRSSMGPRWTIAGPIQSYHAGGGEGGLHAFMEKIGGTVGSCWDASDEDVKKHRIRVGEAWQDDICNKTKEAYGVVDTAERDAKTRRVLAAVQDNGD